MTKTCSDEVTNLKFSTQPWRNTFAFQRFFSKCENNLRRWSSMCKHLIYVSCYCSNWQLIHTQSTKSFKIGILLVCQSQPTCSSSSYLVQSNNRFPHALPFVRHRGCPGNMWRLAKNRFQNVCSPWKGATNDPGLILPISIWNPIYVIKTNQR